MSPGREWRTTDEIKAIIHEETKPDFRSLHGKLDEIAELSRKGTNAAFNTATLLTGDAAMGIKGALPDIQERLAASETRERDRDHLWDERHKDHTWRLENLEKGQHRIRRFCLRCIRVLVSTQGEDGREASGWKIGTLAGVVVTTWRWSSVAVTVVSRKIMALGHALTR